MCESEPAIMLVYRRMHAAEAEAAAQLHRRVDRAAWPWTPDLSTPAAEIAMYRDTVFTGGAVIGAFGGDVLRGFIATIPGWIEHLYVDVDFQGLGIGSGLLEQAMSSADDLQLWTCQANTATRRFYQRHGFIVAELTDGASLAEREPNVRYRWHR